MRCAQRFLPCVWFLSSIAIAEPMTDRAELMSVYRQAVVNDSDLAAARAEFSARQESVPQAQANLLPTIIATTNIESTHLARDQPALTRTRSGTTVQASLRQPLFNAAFWFELNAAKASTAQAALELSAKEQELILKTAEAYYEALRNTDRHAAAIAEETALKEQQSQAEARLKGGLSSITDVLDAQSAYDNAKANTKVAQRQVFDAFEQLTRLTNTVYVSIEGMRHEMPFTGPIPSDTQSWVDAAMRQNVMLLASNYAVQAAEENLNQRRAGHAPTINAVASYRRGDNDSFGYSNPSDFGLDGYRSGVSQSTVSLEMNIPLYSGGRINSQSRQAYDQLTRSEELRESQRREVVLNARNFFRAVNSDVEQIRARKRTIFSSQRSLKATKVSVDVGVRNTVDVLNSQRQLYKAVRDYNDARYDFILNSLRLKRTAGVLAVDDLKVLSEYLKGDYQPQRDFLPPEFMHGSN